MSGTAPQSAGTGPPGASYGGTHAQGAGAGAATGGGAPAAAPPSSQNLNQIVSLGVFV